MVRVASVRDLLIEVEDKLDKLNNDLGNKDRYCLFCNSKTYDGQWGIAHNRGCIIIKLRRMIDETRD